jgi:Family of unknown function (DUF5996)
LTISLLAHLRHRPYRFSDRHIDQPATADPVTREAYSREVISFGFWFGDDRFAEPAFYAYVAPEPADLADAPLQPAAAWSDPRDGSHLAVLRYDDARATSDTRASALDFYESAYQAGARLAGWDVRRLACPGGITDPGLRRPQDSSLEQARDLLEQLAENALTSTMTSKELRQAACLEPYEGTGPPRR